MAHYLVTALPRSQRLQELQRRLARDEFAGLRPSAGNSRRRCRAADGTSSSRCPRSFRISPADDRSRRLGAGTLPLQQDGDDAMTLRHRRFGGPAPFLVRRVRVGAGGKERLDRLE